MGVNRLKCRYMPTAVTHGFNNAWCYQYYIANAIGHFAEKLFHWAAPAGTNIHNALLLHA